MAYYKYKNYNIYYNESGKQDGIPLLLLHGNTASSVMFQDIIPEFEKECRVIVIDFLGCGKSDRVKELATDLWYDQAMQVLTFLREKKISKVNLIGTSGGALTAINVALERPELVNKLIADSFEGLQADPQVTDSLRAGREASKQDSNAKMFYQMMNGEDWESVVDADTTAVIAHAKNIRQFFHKSIKDLSTEYMLTGSRKDPFFPQDYYENVYNDIVKEVGHGNIQLYKSGGHPAMLSNKEKFIQLSLAFFR